MKKFKNVFYAILLASPLFFVSCSEETTDDTTIDDSKINYEAPLISEKDTLVTVPALMRKKSETDYNLMMGIMYVDLANGLAKTYTSGLYFDDSDFKGWNVTVNSDGSKTYYWVYGALKYWFTYLNTSTKKTWKYEFETSEVKRYTWYYAEETGNTGKFQWFIEGTTKVGWQCDWNITDAKSTINIYTYDQETGLLEEKWVTENNKDKSGFVKIYKGESTPYWFMNWTAAGTGSYTNYKKDGATIEYSGTFKK